MGAEVILHVLLNRTPIWFHSGIAHTLDAKNAGRLTEHPRQQIGERPHANLRSELIEEGLGLL